MFFTYTLTEASPPCGLPLLTALVHLLVMHNSATFSKVLFELPSPRLPGYVLHIHLDRGIASLRLTTLLLRPGVQLQRTSIELFALKGAYCLLGFSSRRELDASLSVVPWPPFSDTLSRSHHHHHRHRIHAPSSALAISTPTHGLSGQVAGLDSALVPLVR